MAVISGYFRVPATGLPRSFVNSIVLMVLYC